MIIDRIRIFCNRRAEQIEDDFDDVFSKIRETSKGEVCVRNISHTVFDNEGVPVHCLTVWYTEQIDEAENQSW